MRALALLVAAALAAPAVAHNTYGEDDRQQVGTRFLASPETADAQRARQMQKRIARCMYDRDKDKAVALLQHSDFQRIDYDSLAIGPDKLFDQFEISSCMEIVMHQDEYQISMKYQWATMRNLLAEEAYLDARPDGLKPAELASETVTARPLLRALSGPADSIAKMEDCLTFHGAVAADRLLHSRPASGGESEAFAALAPALGKCMPSGKGEAKLNISLVRQMLADGMWTRARYGDGSNG